MVSPPKKGEIKEARCQKQIIVSDYSLCNTLPLQLMNFSEHYKFVGGCYCSIYSKSMHFYFLTWNDHQLKQFKSKVTTFNTEVLVK